MRRFAKFKKRLNRNMKDFRLRASNQCVLKLVLMLFLVVIFFIIRSCSFKTLAIIERHDNGRISSPIEVLQENDVLKVDDKGSAADLQSFIDSGEPGPLSKLSSFEIPHQLFQSCPVQGSFSCTDRFQRLKKNWKHNVFNDEDVAQYINQNMGSDFYNQTWLRLPLRVMKYDVWRYLVIYQEGGCYLDCDAGVVEHQDQH